MGVRIIKCNSLDDIFIPSVMMRIFGINIATVYNSCKKYKIPAYKVARSCQRIYKYTDLWRLVKAKWFNTYYEGIKDTYSVNNRSSIVATDILLRYQVMNDYVKYIYDPVMYELDMVIDKKIVPLDEEELKKAIYVGLIPIIYFKGKYFIEHEYCKRMRREDLDIFEIFRVN